MVIDDLLALVEPPPNVPVFDWDACELVMGTALPDDYKEIVNHYGRGGFYLDLGIWVPPHPSVPLHGTITEQGPWARNTLTELRSTFPAGIEWMLPDGLQEPVDLGDADHAPFLGWGANGGGTYGFWHTVGADPNTWAVIYTDLGGSWDYHPGGLGEYLIAKFTGTFPENTDAYDQDEYGEPYFEPWPAD